MTTMYQFHLSPELLAACPRYRVAAIYAAVQNTPSSEGLWQEIADFTRRLG